MSPFNVCVCSCLACSNFQLTRLFILIFGCVCLDILHLVILNSYVTTFDPAPESASHRPLLLALLEFSRPGNLPFLGKVTSRWLLQLSYFPGYLLDSWKLTDPCHANEGLPHHHRSLQPQTLVFLPIRPFGLHQWKCSFYYIPMWFPLFCPDAGLTASASWPLGFLSLESGTRPLCPLKI